MAISKHIERKRIAVVTIGGTPFMQGERLKPGEVKLPPLSTPSKQRTPVQLPLFGYSPEETENSIEINHHGLFNIDSSQIRTRRLNELGQKLAELSNDKTVDAVIVVSGTDKMHRIVTRMAHHVHDLKKPVVFTGAQIKSSQQGSDFPSNYRHAVRAAYDLSEHGINQVVLCFGLGKPNLGAEIYHSLNALKHRAERLDAFNHEDKRLVGTVKLDTGIALTHLGQHLARRETKRKPPGKTTFTRFHDDLLDVVEVPETKSIKRLFISRKARVISARGSGKGHLVAKALRAIAERAHGRPVIITTEAGAHVDLASYAPGADALQKGMLPSGGLIPISAEIRAEYLAHHMREIKRYAEQHCPPETTPVEFQRRLFAALYLSGAEFKGKNTKEKHEAALGIKIPNHEVLINKTIQEALIQVHNDIKNLTPTTKRKLRRYDIAQQKRRGPGAI